MFEKLLKEWANEQGFDGWSQDHAAVLRNLSKWLNMHAVEQPLATVCPEHGEPVSNLIHFACGCFVTRPAGKA